MFSLMGKCDSLFLIAQVADQREDVAFQLDLLQFVNKEAVNARTGSSLMRSDLVLLAGHREATSSFFVVDIVAQVQHHELPLGSLLTLFENSTRLLLVHHDGLVA